MTLYSILGVIRLLMDKLEETGELTPELEAELTNLEIDFEGKVENILKYRAGQVAAADAIRGEINRLQQMAQAHDRRAESLKEYVKRSMESLGIQKLDCKMFPVRIQKNSRPAIGLADPNVPIPSGFEKLVVSFDSQLAFKYWQLGAPLPPEIRVVQGTHLRVG